MLVYQQGSFQAVIKHRFGGTISIGGVPFKETAEIHSTEVANRQGKTICDTDLTTGRKKALTQIFLNLLLQFPEIRRRPQKDGSGSNDFENNGESLWLRLYLLIRRRSLWRLLPHPIISDAGHGFSRFFRFFQHVIYQTVYFCDIVFREHVWEPF